MHTELATEIFFKSKKKKKLGSYFVEKYMKMI